MTDRELLEMAAKAAGIKARWFKVNLWKNGVGARFHAGTKDVFGTHHAKPWNPLTDDGDALRLAAKLGLVICTDKRSVYAKTIPGITPSAYASQGGPDHMANICRAITRAAAEIGRAMP